jgi:hypothetical protein
MTAVAGELIATVHSAGGSFRIVGGRVRVEAPAPLSCELMERLRALKGDVLALLASAEQGRSPLTSAAIADAIEERAALAADCVPACYLDAWARLQCQQPLAIDTDMWRLAIDDAGRFLDAWGNQAAEMGWTRGELFDVAVGLVWHLNGESVEAIGADHVRLSCGRVIRRTEMKVRM